MPGASPTSAQLRAQLASLTNPRALRETARQLLQRQPHKLGITPDEMIAMLDLAATIARTGTEEDLDVFLRTGRLPEVVALTARQMESVRGGRLNLTETRGLTPMMIIGAGQRG